jgi:predicted transcriptional regulator
MATKSLAKLKEQRRQAHEGPASATESSAVEHVPAARRSSKKKDEVHITVYGPIAGKTALEELCIARKKELGRKVTLRELAFEAFNDILKKYGKAPIFPNGGAS